MGSKGGQGTTPGHRVVFIDLARALAVVFMLYGHTVSALLAPRYQAGAWYDVWQFQRGLTSSMFLLLSGFAFSVATTRHWSSHLVLGNAFFKRVRRFALLILLGYGLHFPSRFVLLPQATGAQWQAFMAVDVLQLIGVTLLGVQLLVLASRSRGVFTVVVFALAAAIVSATPWVWSVPWRETLPPALAAYLTQAEGSLFPLLPWAAYLLLGTGLGQLYARWDATHLPRYSNAVLLLPGALMLAMGLSNLLTAEWLVGRGPGAFIPPQFLVRAGTCLTLLGLLAHASRSIAHLPRIFGAVAQETLVIYFVHLCIVYGSVWMPGLATFYAASLGPWAVAGCVVVLVAAMAGLASYWNWFKHVRPRAARWVAVAALTALVLRLL